MTRVPGQAERAWGSAYFSSFGRRPAVTWILQKPCASQTWLTVPETIELAQGGPRPEEGRGLTDIGSEQTSGWSRKSRFRDGGRAEKIIGAVVTAGCSAICLIRTG